VHALPTSGYTAERCHGVRFHGYNWLLAMAFLFMKLHVIRTKAYRWWTDCTECTRCTNFIDEN